MKRLLEMEKVLVNTSFDLNRVEGENVALKKEMEALKLSASVSAKNMDKSLAKEQETVKKCQAAEVERSAHYRRSCRLSRKKQLIYNSNKRKPTRA